MRAIQIEQFGDPAQVLRVVDIEEPPPPGPHEVLLSVEVSPLNKHDLLVVSGMLARPPLPHIPGAEGVARVLATGAEVDGLQVGDLVVLPLYAGAWRERLVVPADGLFALPAGGNIEQYSMLGSNPPTAGLMLSECTPLQPGDWVVQNAANSGVGRSLIALAKLRGLKTINLARDDATFAELTAAGADVVHVDEMCHVAAEMERQGFDVPLLIGGATTSRVHTAVKIHPNYKRGQAIYVNDASRAVGVVSALMASGSQARYVADIRAEYVRIAAAHARGEKNKVRLPLLRRAPMRSSSTGPALIHRRCRCFFGMRTFADIPVAELIDYIDWSPFFATWELTGKFPAILDDPKLGEAARSLYADAQAMLQRMIDEGWFAARAVIGLWPANSDGDDILIFADETRNTPIATLHTLRQQLARREGRANVALADFIAPRASGLRDYVGAFAVTAGLGEDAVVERFKHANDDYSAIMAKALADRLAEALAECVHRRVRREFWAYDPGETLSSDELIAERYRGIRPAPGYPAQPDHTEKQTLFGLLGGESAIGVKLTESFAMWPGASVCGLYFSHPESYYFGVGKIERDQVEDYARRKDQTLAETERWLAPILNYDPAALAQTAAE